MAFSIQPNHVFPMPPVLPFLNTDLKSTITDVALRQQMDPKFQDACNLELISNILAAFEATKTQMKDQPKLPCLPLGSLLPSPEWLQQILTAIQSPNLSMPKPISENRILSAGILPLHKGDSAKLVQKISHSSNCANGMLYRPHNKSSNQSGTPVCVNLPLNPKSKDQKPKRNVNPTQIPNAFQSEETGSLVPTLIDGEVIMGFNVWGEKRLCLPHLFRFVLNDVDLETIDEACTKLQITCTTCSPAQLNLLHARKILPLAVSSCGLIRKSDAERLTKFIRSRVECERSSKVEEQHESQQSAKSRSSFFSQREGKSLNESSRQHILNSDIKSPSTESSSPCNSKCSHTSEPIPVIHKCFGAQLGLIYPDLYTKATAKCIECQTCHRLFSPDQFVGHTHRITEVDNFNHWGFDSSNWRCYLRLYTGRRSLSSSFDETESVSDLSDDEFSNIESEINFSGAHRRLEQFKVKFAQPIQLPPSLSAALRTVGICASVAPIVPVLSSLSYSSTSDVDVSASTQRPTTSSGTSNVKSSVSTGHSGLAEQPCRESANLPSMLYPQWTLRRLWAPNDGRIRVPPPPKQMTNRQATVLPKRLQTGPPVLLNSRRVIPQNAAENYDRDFIPNVCLMPAGKDKANDIYRRRHMRVGRASGSSSGSSSSSRGSSGNRTRNDSASSSSNSSCNNLPHEKVRCNRASSSLTLSKCSSSISSPICVDGDSSDVAKLRRKRRSRSWSHRENGRPLSNRSVGHSDSRFRLYACRFSELGCRSNSATDSLSRGSDKQTFEHQLLIKRTNLTCADMVKKRHETKEVANNHRVSLQKDRAVAAAKSAQDAARRVTPGIWSRHFVNPGTHNGAPLQLPNARKPQARKPDKRATGPPVLVTNPNKNSLPAAALALESVWAELLHHIDEYTTAVKSTIGVDDARSRLLHHFVAMQTCYTTHIVSLMKENKELKEQLNSLRSEHTITQAPVNEQRENSSETINSFHETFNGNFSDAESARNSSTINYYPHCKRKPPSGLHNRRSNNSSLCSDSRSIPTDSTSATSCSSEQDHMEHRPTFEKKFKSCVSSDIPSHAHSSSSAKTSQSSPSSYLSSSHLHFARSFLPSVSHCGKSSSSGFRIEKLASNQTHSVAPVPDSQPRKRPASVQDQASTRCSKESLSPPQKRRSILPPRLN